MEKTKPKKDPTNYKPIGESFCEGKCDRKVIQTNEGIVVVCDGCNRTVIDNRI